MSQLKGKTVLIIGAGPTRIGQGGECDQGAVEACEALTAMGCRVITVDSNPDAVLTDHGLGHKSYIEPLTEESLRQIIAAENPHAILNSFGGRSGLYLGAQLLQDGHNNQQRPVLWGTPAETLRHLQDRDGLKSILEAIHLRTPSIFSTTDLEAAANKAQEMGYPVVLRCDDAEIMTDGALVYNQEELHQRAAPVATEGQAVLSVEESLWGWRQVELEILRDSQGQTVVAGIVDYMDSAGIHPGDAIGITPPQTLTPQLRQKLETHALDIATHLGIVGNATIRFAYDPVQAAILVTAVHPRYTRTSALVSFGRAIPIASLAAVLAAGLIWKQLPKALAKYSQTTPENEVIAVKWPVWAFDRLNEVPDRLGPQMQSVGQALGLGLTFGEAMQKALRGANPGIYGPGRLDMMNSSAMTDQSPASMTTATSRRPFMIYDALLNGEAEETLARQTSIDPWFIRQLRGLAALEQELTHHQGQLPPDDLLRQAKTQGFSDHYLAKVLSVTADAIAEKRSQIGLTARWYSFASQNDEKLSVQFSTYGTHKGHETNKNPKDDPFVLILGSGPERIGRGSECDHGAFHAAQAARTMGFAPVVLNCNLTSVTIGQAMAARAKVLVDGLDDEIVHAIIEYFKPVGILPQFTGLPSLSQILDVKRLGVLQLGNTPATLETISNRWALWQRIRALGIPQPTAALVESDAEALQKGSEIGYPLLVRPAFWHDRQSAQLLQSHDMLTAFLADIDLGPHRPLFMERFLEYAIEAQAEVLCDGDSALVIGVLEQIELAGVHAGDSACVLPPYSIGPRHVETIGAYATKVAFELKIKGVFNLRFAVYRDSVYFLDAAVRECRNLAMVTKTTQVPVADLATRIVLGQKLKDLSLTIPKPAYFGVRAAVFPFNVFSEMDTLLGPSMRSTGEVLAMADSFSMAYFKAMAAADTPLPTQGNVLITVTDEDKPSILEPARIFNEQGFKLLATKGTQTFLVEQGLQAEVVRKLGFGRPHLVDEMKNGRVQMVINTPSGDQGLKDGSYIRKAAIRRRIVNINTPAGAIAAAKGIAARRQGSVEVRPLNR
ncbi:MAG: carbamoyl-phosphate synthase large subunit [Desulfobacteraceae bacterium]|nr:carbamoyl-phosphate synthase large subunit [Desulfobacteraceae bacterium]